MGTEGQLETGSTVHHTRILSKYLGACRIVDVLVGLLGCMDGGKKNGSKRGFQLQQFTVFKNAKLQIVGNNAIGHLFSSI